MPDIPKFPACEMSGFSLVVVRSSHVMSDYFTLDFRTL